MQAGARGRHRYLGMGKVGGGDGYRIEIGHGEHLPVVGKVAPIHVERPRGFFDSGGIDVAQGDDVGHFQDVPAQELSEVAAPDQADAKP